RSARERRVPPVVSLAPVRVARRVNGQLNGAAGVQAAGSGGPAVGERGPGAAGEPPARAAALREPGVPGGVVAWPHGAEAAAGADHLLLVTAGRLGPVQRGVGRG